MVDPNSKGTKVVFWNVRSIWNKFQLIKQQITTSNFQSNIRNCLLDIPGYQMMRNDRVQQRPDGQVKRGGGIIVYYKSDINFSQLTSSPYTFSNEHIECLTSVYQPKFTRKCYVTTVYRPPNGNIDLFCESLDLVCNSLTDREQSDIIVGGDFNINFPKN